MSDDEEQPTTPTEQHASSLEMEQCKADFVRLQDELDKLRKQSLALKKEQHTYKLKIIEHMKATNQTMLVFASVKFEIGSKQVLRLSKDAFHSLEIDDETKNEYLPWVPFTSCKKIKNA
jgi:SMC interacting uncharacterized protein involved in chromosome segregation